MLKRLTNIFFEMGKDKETVSLDVFLRHMEHEEMKMHLSLIGVHFCDGVALFRFWDVDRTGFLTIEQFVMGCLRLKGEAILIEMDNSLRQTKDMLMDIQDTLATALTDHRRSGAESSTSTDFCSVPGDSCQQGEASAHQTSVSISRYLNASRYDVPLAKPRHSFIKKFDMRRKSQRQMLYGDIC